MDPAERDSSVLPATDTVLAPGTLVGRYVILDVLGRGGMSVVYAAYDGQLGRKIAIKLLRASVASSVSSTEGQARMLREAQAMARLSHPNVVSIHDVGTYGEANVFLAMEFVEGCTLNKWLKKRRTLREKLDVMKAAGRGLAAAHAAGIIHRDFKPDNVLIGDDGRVVVTDFGIARADPATPPVTDPSSVPRRDADSGPTPSTPLEDPITVTGSVLGTVGYMPPEPAEEADARSDQFSYCASLFLVLYGQRPYPSDSVNTYFEALDKGPVIPPGANGVPGWLRKIVLKGLSYESAARFASMNALIEALERDPSRTSRRLVAALGVLAAIGIGFGACREYDRQQKLVCAADPSLLAGAWDAHVKEDVHRAFLASGAAGAEEVFARVSERLDAHAAAWRDVHESTCEASLVRKEKSVEDMALGMSCLDRERTDLAALTSVFTKADAQVVARAVSASFDLTPPQACADAGQLRAIVALPSEPGTRARVLEVRAQLARAESLRLSGKYEEALAAAQPALAGARAIPHAGTEAETLYAIGQTNEQLGDYDGAEAPYEQAVWAAERAGNDALIARASSRLAFVLGDKLARMPEADRWGNLADAALARLGPNEDVEGDILAARAVLLTTQGRAREALPMHERLLPIRERTLGPNHLVTAKAVNNLGYNLQLVGEHARALELHKRSLAIRQAVLPADDAVLAVDYANLGSSSLGLGRWKDAIDYLGRAIDVAERRNAGSFWAAWALEFMSLARTMSGDTAEALAAARRGIELAERGGGEKNRVLPALLVAEGLAELARGDDAGALASCERALALEPPRDPDRVYPWDALACVGEARIALGRAKDAIEPLEQSVTRRSRVFAWDLPRAELALARALSLTHGDPLRAHELAERARDGFLAAPLGAAKLAEIDQWLAEHPADGRVAHGRQ